MFPVPGGGQGSKGHGRDCPDLSVRGSSYDGTCVGLWDLRKDESVTNLAPMGGQTPHPPKNGGERATPGPVLPYPAQPFDFSLKLRGMR